jgi:hypothetical protein
MTSIYLHIAYLYIAYIKYGAIIFLSIIAPRMVKNQFSKHYFNQPNFKHVFHNAKSITLAYNIEYRVNVDFDKFQNCQ